MQNVFTILEYLSTFFKIIFLILKDIRLDGFYKSNRKICLNLRNRKMNFIELK